jgi:hypothetical protein
MPVPEGWESEISGRTVDALPLVRDVKGTHSPGWCTYTYEHAQAPELEVLCGGINHKTPQAGAVWRQGNLLHFGFNPAPDAMNDAGRALLVNCIPYIARFTEDRVLVHTPCIFVQRIRLFDRDAIGRRLQNDKADLKVLEYYLDKETYKALQGKSRAEMKEWFKLCRGYLHADGHGLLQVDAEAQAFGVSPALPEFLDKAIAGLREPGRAAASRLLLARYVPDGPGVNGTSERWQSWREENNVYLFFSDTGGYHWYVDQLAKRKGIPSVKLRGSARASLPPLEAGARR